MIRVGICTSPLKSGHKMRGIGFYTKNLLESLQQRSDVEVIEFDDVNKIRDVDLIHYPYFDLFYQTLPIVKKLPTVVTIHDVIPLVFPKYYPPGIKGKIGHCLQKFSLLNVRAIITDSQSSKHDIEKYLGINPVKIYPIYLAPDKNFKSVNNKKELNKISKKYSLPEFFSLFLGNVNWNKNLVNLTQACLDAGVDLVLIGKDFENKDDLDHPERKSYKEFLEKFANNPKIHILGFIPDKDLRIIFTLAQMLLYPSFHEGFGLPVLEAQACGIPVVTSNISSLPEVAGEGAIFVDPYDVKNIKDVILKLMIDQDLKTRLIQKGFDNVKKFSWDKTAAETVLVYQQVIKNV